MKLVIAPDSYKESLSAGEVCAAFAEGWQRARPEDTFEFLPLADGGEGTTVAITNACDGTIKHHQVTGPTEQPVNGFIGLWGEDNAVIEIAAASGLHQVPFDSRNPELTTSFGTGELIKFALDQGARNLVIGLGGSGTNDGGAGILQALGVKLLDDSGKELNLGAKNLTRLETIDITEMDSRLTECKIQVASDVNNPLLGDNGASAIFGPQKGATPEQVDLLDSYLEHFANKLESYLDKPFRNLPGSGAAGGAGFALLSVLSAEFVPGIELVLDLMSFGERIKDADLIVTGEGRMDHQSLMGKAPQGVLNQALLQNKPIIGIAGSIGDNSQALLDAGFTSIFDITPGAISLEQALQDARYNLINTASNLARFYSLAKEH